MKELIDNEKIEDIIQDTARGYDLEIDIFDPQPNDEKSAEKACNVWLNGVDFCEQINYHSAIDLLAELVNTKIPSDMELIKAISEQSDRAKTLNLNEITKELNYIKKQFSEFKDDLARTQVEVSQSHFVCVEDL